MMANTISSPVLFWILDSFGGTVRILLPDTPKDAGCCSVGLLSLELSLHQKSSYRLVIHLWKITQPPLAYKHVHFWRHRYCRKVEVLPNFSF